MHDQTGLLASADALRLAADADLARRAMRAHVLDLVIGVPERVALQRGLDFVENALRASAANSAEQRGATSFPEDAQALQLARAALPPALAQDNLARLSESISAILENRPLDRTLSAHALSFFSRLNQNALEAFREIEATQASSRLWTAGEQTVVPDA